MKQDNLSQSFNLLFSPIDINMRPRSPQSSSESSGSDQEDEDSVASIAQDSDFSDKDESVIVSDALLFSAHDQSLDQSECQDTASDRCF